MVSSNIVVKNFYYKVFKGSFVTNSWYTLVYLAFSFLKKDGMQGKSLRLRQHNDGYLGISFKFSACGWYFITFFNKAGSKFPRAGDYEHATPALREECTFLFAWVFSTQSTESTFLSYCLLLIRGLDFFPIDFQIISVQ